ncbi:aspartate aminotransferase family protein [Streptomyces californicus]|uniref:Aspartate aminotransferase family protein n=1 Tax=Streptomyces californicus TaxID=67351 RepID=A0ABD7D2T6_9ACTN|nr:MULTISPECIES: aspartate aminotransferase family protein [Streptomyces]QRV27823.1 aspartate aminotransferase family protein [Streptomyces californicus]QRV36513.1 aspartate aminotransferase family protein [Streptomyces californicus]QRV41222.1 aspartate aminotransferase family protein [Streptomyces californicus]QRV47978.1 aspartate aminotransferase family protein [Streptomyces californicus]
MRAHLLNNATAEHYRTTVSAGVERVAATLAATERPFSGVGVDELSPVVDAIDLDRPLGDAAAALDELGEVYLRDAVYFHRPRYLGHLNCPVVIPAVLGEAVLSAVNSSLDTWDQSAGGTLIERRLIDWTTERIGLGPAADGIFTSGGTQSNLQALLLAREEAKVRPEHFTRLRILTSECSHFSVQKSAKLLGLGPDAVISVPVDRDKRMRTLALARALEQCVAEGAVPMAVVATAGTTDFGSIDPLPEIAALCEQFAVWMHVDAAYGCGLLASRERGGLLDGIAHADSVTVDYHKSFFQPVSSSAVLVRDRAVLRHATYHAEYLNPRRTVEERIPNQVDKSLQTTRRFDALKLWMTLRVMGADGIGELFDQVCDLAAEGWRLLAADPRFDVVVEPRLSTLVFRHIPSGVTAPDEIDRANLYARKALFASGEAIVAGTRVGDRQYLKFTLLNPETTVDDIAAVLDLIAGHAEQYLGDTLDRAS